MISRGFTLVAIGLASALLGGCTGNETKPEPAPIVHDCVFPDAPEVPAPGWVCDEPVAGVQVSAVGSATKSAAGTSFMKQMAATDARVQLAQNVKTHISNMVKQFAETTGAADAETVDMVNTSVSKQITDQDIVGSRIYKTRTSPNGTLYVLVGIDPANAEAITKAALQTSMKNDQAQWQQFRSKKNQEELADEISKMNAQ